MTTYPSIESIFLEEVTTLGKERIFIFIMIANFRKILNIIWVVGI
jgi:hypothetical protein